MTHSEHRDPTPSTAEVASVFVYGTLKRHGARHHLWPYPPVRIVPARVRGTLYDMGPFPALSLSGTDWVGGERWEIAPEDLAETLRMLDDVEGYANRPDDLYRRCIVDCHDEDGTVHSVYTYQFAQLERLLTARRIPPNESGLCSWSE